MSQLSIRRAVPLIAGLALVALIVWWLVPSNARRVRSRFYALAALASVPATEQDLARLARAQRFGTMLTTDAVVTFEDTATPLTGRDAIMMLVARPVGLQGDVTVELLDVNVDVAPDGTTATSSGRARLRFTDPNTKALSAEEHEVHLDWRKVDGEWLMADARIGPALARRLP